MELVRAAAGMDKRDREGVVAYAAIFRVFSRGYPLFVHVGAGLADDGLGSGNCAGLVANCNDA